MSITQSNAREVAARLIDFAEGKLQYMSSLDEVWEDISKVDLGRLTESVGSYRRKPEPKLRAWRWDEVPVGAVFRRKGEETYEALCTLSTSSGTIYIGISDFTAPVLLLDFEWHWPGPVAFVWMPCGVEES